MHSHQNITHIRADIAETKSHISSTLDEIDARRLALKDWRVTIRKFPFISLGLAILMGMLLSKRGLHYLKPPQPLLSQMLWGVISAKLLKKSMAQSYTPKLKFP